MPARAGALPSPSRYSMSVSGVGEWGNSVAMGGPCYVRRARLERGLQRGARAKQLRAHGIERRVPEVGDLLVRQLLVLAEHQDFPIALVERGQRMPHPDGGVDVAGGGVL